MPTPIPSGVDRITIIPRLCNGRPTICGLRIAVGTVLGFLAAADSAEEFLAEYALLPGEDITACLAFASRMSARRYAVDAAK